MSNIEKLNPAEYGLKEAEVQPIENAFAPKIMEREALKTVYETLITQELSPTLCKDAHDLRVKLVKVRTGIAEIHKTQKAYFLAAGRFVDEWKKKETAPVEQMEEKLEEIEKYYENLEKERKAKLKAERMEGLAKYEVDGSLMLLAEMTDDVWINYLAGVKLQYEARKEAERKAEEDRLAAIEAEKKRQEEIRLENERLKKEAEEREKTAAAERKKLEAEREKAEKARRDAEEKARKEKEEADRKLKAEQEEARKKLEAIQAEKDKAEAELRAKGETEERAKKEEQARLQAEEAERIKAEKRAAAAPDKEKLLALAHTISSLSLPELKTPEAGQILANIKTLLAKVDTYIKEKAAEL